AKVCVGSLKAELPARTNGEIAVKPIEFTVLTLPGRNWEWLKMLKPFAANSRFVLSVRLKRFTTVRSQLLVRGVARVLRPAVARAPFAAWMYCALGLTAT